MYQTLFILVHLNNQVSDTASGESLVLSFYTRHSSFLNFWFELSPLQCMSDQNIKIRLVDCITYYKSCIFSVLTGYFNFIPIRSMQNCRLIILFLSWNMVDQKECEFLA
jgi:hypothetical protein